MRLPSLDRLVEGAVATARRFPLLLLCAATAAVASCLAIEGGDERFWVRVLASATLGLPLFVALVPLAEGRGWSAGRAWLLRGAGLLVPLAVFLAWPRWSHPVAAIRYFHLTAGLHLLAAFLPWLGRSRGNGFWQYNRVLFLRFLLAGLYAFVLFAGLAIGLAGVDNLLGVDIDPETYPRLGFVIAFLFTTWLFAAGIPEDLESLERRQDYPSGLRIFAQFVLVPLVAVYLLILTLYLGKVLVTRTWPSGWIGYLVSALAALGILGLLLVHPERSRPDRRWIELYARGFWIAILPSVAMLLLALWKRVDQYGVTERRYLLGALSVWLAGVAIGYAVTGSRRIRRIPQSLALVAFLTFLGPWSAYQVSEASQRARLRDLLERHGMFEDGRARAAPGEVPADARREMTGALRYLVEHHGTGSLDPWFGGELARIDTIARSTEPARRGEAYERSALLLRHLDLEPVVALRATDEWIGFATAPSDVARPIGEFDLALPAADLTGDRFQAAGDTIAVVLLPDSTVIRLTRNGRPLIDLPLDPLLERAPRLAATSARALDPDSLRVEARNERAVVSLYAQTLGLRRDDGRLRLGRGRGDLYLRLLEER